MAGIDDQLVWNYFLDWRLFRAELLEGNELFAALRMCSRLRFAKTEFHERTSLINGNNRIVVLDEIIWAAQQAPARAGTKEICER